MMNSKLKDFLDDIVQRGPQVDYWFMTKQTLSDFYFELFISQIVERYQISGKKNCFDKFYSEQFKADHFMNEKYPKQGASLNTFRNTIITEYLGLTFRTGNTYDTCNTTDAYDLISKYIKTPEDMEIYHELVERQIEKMAFNVLTNNKGDSIYEDITIFAIMLLYKILYELYIQTGSSLLSYNEFVLFVMRTKKYSDWKECIELIKLSREYENFDDSEYIDKIVNQQYVKDIRFDELFSELPHIKYVSDKLFEIKDDEDVAYIKNTLDKFENSIYCEITDKKVMREFLCSSNYFDGTLDHDLDMNNINNLLSIDKLDESVAEEIVEKKIRKRNPAKVKNIDSTFTIKIIDFPDGFKVNKIKNTIPIVRLYNFENITKRKANTGKKAEELVMEYEKLRLAHLGYSNLINMVEHVSKTKGDGLGYDILSFDIIDDNIVPIYIEVKGTMMDENTPFDITRNELEVARIHGKNYRLYRISSLGDNIAKCFILDGEELQEKFDFEPMVYKAFKKNDEVA